ncbi:hypothetical protein FB45DRAFT_722118, partial [Roridomyces roridus]
LIAVWHPLQNGQGAPMLELPAFPGNPDPDAPVGVSVGLVLDASSILAKNRRGELQLLAAPHDRIADDSTTDQLLSPGYYQFVVVAEGGELVYDWDICPSFDDWVPPADIPLRWRGGEDAWTPPRQYCISDSDSSAAVKGEDGACVVTRSTVGLQSCRMVPESALDWWEENWGAIRKYGGNPTTEFNSPRNMIAMRYDLDQQSRDTGLFVFAPYAGRIVSVFLVATGGELAYQYHMTEVEFPTRVRRAYVFLRFAWTVLK